MQSQIDPDWAWQPFQPTTDNPWDVAAAAHLFRRAGFGATWTELQNAVAGTPEDAIEGLFAACNEPQDFLQTSNALARATLAGGDPGNLAAWWAHRMLTSPAQLLEKTTLFWHGHFATSVEKVQDSELMLQQNRLLRQFALGDFPKLLLEISRDPAMLLYLDSATNRKAHPNENFAREIMELFCLGEGNYSEHDIRELARCFTGWEVKRKRFRFNRYQHDNGSKSVLGQTGTFGGEEGVRIVADQQQAPEFLARKLFQYFVADEPVPSQELLKPLVQQLNDDNLHVATTVRRILQSQIFFSPSAKARKIKSPAEFVIGFLRCLEVSTSSYEVAAGMKKLGQGLFEPPSVKGWDGGRTWINSSTLLSRSNLIKAALDHDKTRFARTDLKNYLKQNDIRTPAQLIERLQGQLFAVPISRTSQAKITQAVTSLDESSARKIIHALCTLPEFQLA